MITNKTIKLMWSAIFSSFPHPCVMSGVLADVILDIGVDMFPDMAIIVLNTPVITLQFVVRVAYAVDVLADLPVAAIIDVVSATDVDILTDENANGLAAVMTPLEFALPAPCEESMPFC